MIPPKRAHRDMLPLRPWVEVHPEGADRARGRAARNFAAGHATTPAPATRPDPSAPGRGEGFFYQAFVYLAAALLLIIGTTLLMSRVGLSPALGTFLAGVVLANCEYRHELVTDIEPFKGLLLGLFFIAVGASLDFRLPAARPELIGGLVVGIVAVKLAVLFDAGVDHVYRQTLDSSLKLGIDALRLLGFRAYSALRAARTLREYDERYLRVLSKLRHDTHIYMNQARQRIQDLEEILQVQQKSFAHTVGEASDSDTLLGEVEAG